MVSVSINDRSIRRRATAAVAIGLIVVVAWVMARDAPKNGEGESAKSASVEDQFTPEKCIQRWLEAAQAGDAKTYLNCFAGRMHDRLASGFNSRSVDDSNARLKSGTADLKSYVTTDTKRLSETEATLLLERIYGDRNDKERVRLKRFGNQWKIVEMTPVDRFAPEIPYGTLVAPEVENEKDTPRTSDTKP